MLLVSDLLVAGNGGVAALARARGGSVAGLRSHPSIAIKLWHSDCVCAVRARSTEGAVVSGHDGGCAPPKFHARSVPVVSGANFLRA